MKDLGIYIHIPFCKSKCFYCDFYSKPECTNSNIEEYIDTICMELLANSELLQERNITTVYFGGGTPSLIDAKYIAKILDIIRLFNNSIEEITIEANPESLNKEKLTAYLEAGVNRLSLGLQSANNNTLKKIGRIATKEMFEKAYMSAVEAGFSNISTDVIIGLPNETLEDFKNTVEYILSLDKIKHISAYSLEVHEGTKLDFLLNSGFLTLPDENTEREMKYMLDKMLEEKGFNRYEISNYAKPKYESKHNTAYWTQQEYLGLGAAAASFINSTRYTNIPDMDKYIQYMKQGISVKQDIEEMDLLDTMKEYIILRLRLKEGLNFNEFKLKFKKDVLDMYKEQIDKLVEEKLLEKDDVGIRLTYKGEDLANIVWQEFI
ncbi:MAG: radical SAM family heme chaperone HemW [Clostridia bacterium]|nr:radical SAM family heme chaperone HemW [Clostridia bacterium]